MTDWTLTYGGVSVTLPLGIREFNESADTNLDSFEQDGDRPILTVKNLSERTLPLQGSIYVSGQTYAYLETNYLSKLRAIHSKEVVVTSPDNQFDGNWILKSYSFRCVAEGASWKRYQFVLVLVQGSSHNAL